VWRRAALVLTAVFYGFFVCLWLTSVLGASIAPTVSGRS